MRMALPTGLQCHRSGNYLEGSVSVMLTITRGFIQTGSQQTAGPDGLRNMITQQSRSSSNHASQLRDQKQLDRSAQSGSQEKGQGQLRAPFRPPAAA